MQAWARLDPQQRETFLRAGLKAATRLQPLQFREWLLRRLRYRPLVAPLDPACFTISAADVALLLDATPKANKARRSGAKARASLSQVSL